MPQHNVPKPFVKNCKKCSIKYVVMWYGIVVSLLKNSKAFVY